MPNIPSSASSIQPKKRKLTSNIEKNSKTQMNENNDDSSDDASDSSDDTQYEVEEILDVRYEG